ncbi:nucleotidyltransferase family protein [Owenweeksia hongkongensis]|uniref:nucleotidyltransferase family protein n=1 Tax=Owenweeksia hongkongensis TaxID=253245 RepID=UPI003A957B4A
MKSLEQIKSALVTHKATLSKRYPIKSLAIFGSYSRGDQNDSSDVDILVEFDGKIGLKFIDLAEEIESLLGNKVDLVSKNEIKQKYIESINSDLIYV